MSLFRRILKPKDLPPETTDRETWSFDVKGKDLRAYSQEKLAEHIAAMSNGPGGNIIVGANEQPGGTFTYDYMNEAEADANRIKYEHANRDHCSPNPILEAVVIQKSQTEFVAVINIWPSPAGAIGVRQGPKDKPAWLFPLRVGTQTKYLNADQLPMIMLPELRKSAILLSQLAKGSLIKVLNPGGGKNTVVQMDEVHPERGTFTVAPVGKPAQSSSVPLEAVLYVWQTPNGWQIALKGALYEDASFQPETQLRQH